MDTTSNYFDNVASKQMNDRRIDPARGTFKGIFRDVVSICRINFSMESISLALALLLASICALSC
jgi:hypothetical protein